MPKEFIRVGSHQSWCVALIVAFALVTCAGCGSKSPVARVKGKVTLDGQPLATGAVVTLPNAGRGSQGKVQNGEFELSTFGNNDGALIGTHRVAVIAQEKAQGSGPEANAGKLLVPERYANPESSGLSIEVKSGETNTPTLELKSP